MAVFCGNLLQAARIGTGENPVVQGLVGEAFLFQLPLDVLMAVQAELGVMGKIRAELQKEGAEVAVQAVEVIVVHQGGGGLHDPGVAVARLWPSPPFC